jgi:hypothetical protein
LLAIARAIEQPPNPVADCVLVDAELPSESLGLAVGEEPEG